MTPNSLLYLYHPLYSIQCMGMDSLGWVGVPRGIGTSRRWCLVLHASRYTLYSLIPILYLPSYQYPTY